MRQKVLTYLFIQCHPAKHSQTRSFQDFAFPLVELHAVPVRPILQPVKVPMATQPSGVSTIPPILYCL